MRHRLRRVTAVMAHMVLLGAVLKAGSLEARASYGLGDALETVGISTGIGTALGLSTIAFYDQPTSHMKNALVGAGAGLIVGLGVAAYLMAASPESDDISPEELLPPDYKKKNDGSEKLPNVDPTKAEKKRGAFLLNPRFKNLKTSVPVALA